MLVWTVVIFTGVAAAAEMQANAVFLVAKRGLQDPNFRESVVLVTHPRGGAPWGVIINRPLEHRLSEVFPDHPSLQGRKDVLFFGGPVKREGLIFLVRDANPPSGATPVLHDLFFTGDTGLIDSLLKRPDPTRGLRVFAGYSAWGRGQLQKEIALGGWHIVPADAETVFGKDPARVWPELIERATTRHTRRASSQPCAVSWRVMTTGCKRVDPVHSILEGSPLNSPLQYSPPWKSRAGPSGSSLSPISQAKTSASSWGR
jgi:putative transcriptional regulator